MSEAVVEETRIDGKKAINKLPTFGIIWVAQSNAGSSEKGGIKSFYIEIPQKHTRIW